MIKVKDIWRRSGATWMDAAALAAMLGYGAWRYSVIHPTYYNAIGFQWVVGPDDWFQKLVQSHGPDVKFLPLVIAFWLFLRMLGPIRRAAESARRAEVGMTLLSAREYLRRQLARPLNWTLYPSLIYLAYSAFTCWLDHHRYGSLRPRNLYLFYDAINMYYFDAWGVWAALLALTHGVLAYALWRACRRPWGATLMLAFIHFAIAGTIVYGFKYGFEVWGFRYIEWRKTVMIGFYGALAALGVWMTLRYLRRTVRDYYTIE